ncbi:MAG TPA: hypothetical protein VJM79_10095 [Rhizorhapis sp.]|nr:hypothetical protein [Rhizorhapis sp.]
MTWIIFIWHITVHGVTMSQVVVDMDFRNQAQCQTARQSLAAGKPVGKAILVKGAKIPLTQTACFLKDFD